MTHKLKHALAIGSALGLAALIGWALFVPPPTSIPPRPTSIAAINQSTERAEADADRSGEDTDRETEAFDDPDQAIAFRVMRYKDENGKFSIDDLLRASQQVRALRAASAAQRPLQSNQVEAGGIGDWSWLGPGNVGGRIRSIVIHPTNPNRMWVGSVSGGIWTTSNAGASWQPVDDFMANLAVTAMAIDPNNANILYAGTGEGVWGGIGSPSGTAGILGAGVFKSTDGGVTWVQLSATNTITWAFVNRLVVAPGNSQVVLAATNTGLWRTNNGGTTWTQVMAASLPAYDVQFHPTDNTRAIAGGNGAAFYSTDGGVNWSAATGLPAGARRILVAYARSNSSIVYASVDVNRGELWRSTDGGQNYTLVNTGTKYLDSADGTKSQGWYSSALWVDPTNSNQVVVGGVDLFRSTNGGTTLTRISNWTNTPVSPHADQHAIVSAPNYNGTSNRVVFFANDGGLYRANDVTTVSSTSGWTGLNNNLGITQFYGAAGNTLNGVTVIVGGAQDNGTVRSLPPNGEQTWVPMAGGDGGNVAVDQRSTFRAYGSSQYLGLVRSDNVDTANPTPSSITSNLTDAGNVTRTLFVSPFILDPNDQDSMLAGSVSLWRSTNVSTNTPSWTAIKAALCNAVGTCGISAIAVVPGNSDVIWVGHVNGDVYKTTNGLSATPTWTQVDTNGIGLPNRYVTSLTVDPLNTNQVYVTFGGFSANNVWRTDDGGSTWAAASGSGSSALVAAPVNSLVVHPRFSEYLYVGTEVGIFASEDHGQSWALVNQAPANVAVDQLFWIGNRLTAATYGRGVYQTTNPIDLIFVSTTGIDILGCGHSSALPCNSIPYGVNVADAGNTVVVKQGSYTVLNGYTIDKGITLRGTQGLVNIVPTP